jgi:hypothetical protein
MILLVDTEEFNNAETARQGLEELLEELKKQK